MTKPVSIAGRCASLVSITQYGSTRSLNAGAAPPRVSFDRRELQQILQLYGRMVAAGEWRDYAIDFRPGMAIFSIFRHTAEQPLFAIAKVPGGTLRSQAEIMGRGCLGSLTGAQTLTIGAEPASLLARLPEAPQTAVQAQVSLRLEDPRSEGFLALFRQQLRKPLDHRRVPVLAPHQVHRHMQLQVRHA